ncbi:MAG: TetR/AcrR family transcriptional regulator [Anaerolineaceae bacterium]|nr:TetR/AcrR family transcriptional regulator [Anaerolineaceae bacterium]
MKIDRRVQRTRQLLRAALIELILEKGYQAITVQDITDRANLGRATFYLHYPNGKDELLLKMMEETMQDIIQQIGQPAAGELMTDGVPPSLVAFQHAQENAAFYRAVVGADGLAGVMHGYRQSTTAQIKQQIESWLPPGVQPTVPLDFIAHFIFGALNAVIVWWLENENAISAEEMAQRFQKLIRDGINGFTQPQTDARRLDRGREEQHRD